MRKVVCRMQGNVRLQQAHDNDSIEKQLLVSSRCACFMPTRKIETLRIL